MLDTLMFNNGLWGFYTDQPFKVETAKEAPDEDWKTAMAHHIKPIPAGTELIVKEVFKNSYGKFLKVEYNNWTYYINPNNCNFTLSF